MSGRDLIEVSMAEATEALGEVNSYRRAESQGAVSPRIAATSGVMIGELIGIANGGLAPLVRYQGQPGSAALLAQSVVDLHGSHIGKRVVLAFEEADACRPIVMGVLVDGVSALPDVPRGKVEVDADGQRMIVSAKDQLVLRCGAASITLTKAGKVLIQGTYVSSRSSGVNRVKGGSVQLN
jgi:hypothetical protein